MVSGLLACESTSSPVLVYEGDVTPEMVTGAALAALRPDGRLTPETATTTANQLSLQEARTQTLQFARYVTNNGLLRGVVESGRGGYWTDPHLLTICEDAYYVHSQFGSDQSRFARGTRPLVPGAIWSTVADPALRIGKRTADDRAGGN